MRGQLFRDADFAEFYCADNGRDSVPPSLLATALLLQTHDKVSDAEAKARADFDIRWKVALGIEIEDRPFAKSTLQVFRAQLILHDRVRAVFESSLRLGRQPGYLKKRGMGVALDTTNILGRGAVSRDRMMSVHDPEMRHGHKSSSRRFDGHKAAIVVDTDSQLITAVEVLPGNAPDNLGALELVERSEANTGVPVEEALGDAAYGDGDTRQAFADAGRRLVARVPGRPDRKHFPKDDFVIDLAAGSCTCPAGQVTHTIVPAGKRTDRRGRVHRLQAFQFDGAECRTCPLRPQCIAAKGSRGRRVLIHPQEALLQQARALQQSTHYDEYRVRRVVVEHRLARLVQLGIRQSRYFGRVKTRFQLYLAATVANLTLVTGKLGWSGRTGGGATGRSVVLNIVPFVVAHAAANFCAVRLGQLWSVILLTSALLPKSPYSTGTFRPG